MGEKEKTGTDNIQRGFLPTHTHTHTHALCRRRIRAAIMARARAHARTLARTHRQAAAAGRPLARPSHGGEPAEKSSILVQSSLKQQTTPQLPLPHGRSLKTNPAAQNNILRAFYRSRPAPLFSSKSVITDRTGAVFCGSKQILPKRSPNVCNPPRVAVMSSGVISLWGESGPRERHSAGQGRIWRKMLMRLHHEKCSVQFILSRSLRDAEKKVRSVQIPVAPSVDLVPGPLKSYQTRNTF